MVSKNTTVRSIRLPNETWEWLSGEAEKRGTTVNGLVAEGVALMRGRKGVDALELLRASAELAAPWLTNEIGPDGKPKPLRLAREASVAVPLHKPKPFNPQPKRGKK